MNCERPKCKRRAKWKVTAHAFAYGCEESFTVCVCDECYRMNYLDEPRVKLGTILASDES